MAEKIDSFTKLTTWQAAHKLVIAIFLACEALPKYDSVRSQLERAALSISSNIAEGFGRQTQADKRHFYVMARGSTYEVQNQLLVARDTHKFTHTTFDELATLSLDTIRLLHGLIRSLEPTPRPK